MSSLELKIRNVTFGKAGLAGPASSLFFMADAMKGHRQMNAAFERWLPSETLSDKKYLAKLRRDLAYTRFYDDISYDEYFQYRFQNLSREERDRFISVRYTNRVMKHKLDRPAVAITSDKYKTYEFFGPFFRRDVILVEGENDRETFLAFAEKHPEFILKPTNAAHGRGVHKVDASQNAEETFDKIVSEAPFVAEELVVQDAEMAAFHPESVNTVRLVTVCREGKVSFLMCCIRFGLGGSVIDNGTAGGILAAVDTKTGEIVTPAFYLTRREEFEAHPDTGAPIFHTFLPHWDEMRQTTRQMALMVPDQRIVGWDMALTNGHWVLIEANSCPGLQPGVGYYKGLREEFFKAVR
ncbi:MAG: sugar-transfer associated ATP-grasp domain-containing protein [Lachnospiraceae bacterium]